jgi:folate-binding protein YgfZ
MHDFVLVNRGVIKVSGSDARSFLQGLITNDIAKATEDSLMYAMLLSPQGRFLTDFFILKDNDSYFLDVALFNLQDTLKRLTNYVLRSKVEITDLSGKYQVIASFVKLDDTWFVDPRNKAMGFRKFSDESIKVNASSFIEYEKYRIKLKIPDAGEDFIFDKSFPLEYGAIELNAIDFLKGCYVGQEVTARTYHRGVVRKGLMNFEIAQADVLLSKGTEITADGQKIGIVLGINNQCGLALVNTEDYNQSREHELLANNISVKLF